jgi:hypothetical protein
VIGAVPDGQGNILLAGSTLEGVPGNYSIEDPGFPNTVPNTVIANKISLVQPPLVRLDSATDLASQLAAPIAPGEVIALNGSGFGNESQISLNGAGLPTVSLSPTQIVAVMPASMQTSGTLQFAVTSGGNTSNLVQMPATSTSPAIFAILNVDGSLNSSTNPAAPGSAITLLVNGVGPVSVTNDYAITPQTVAVFVDGFSRRRNCSHPAAGSGLPRQSICHRRLYPDPVPARLPESELGELHLSTARPSKYLRWSDGKPEFHYLHSLDPEPGPDLSRPRQAAPV